MEDIGNIEDIIGNVEVVHDSWLKQTYCDMIIIAKCINGIIEIPCHKYKLARSYPYFINMFERNSGELCIKKARNKYDEEIELRYNVFNMNWDYSKECLKQNIGSLYDWNLFFTNNIIENLQGLIFLAPKSRIFDQCIKRLIRWIYNNILFSEQLTEFFIQLENTEMEELQKFALIQYFYKNINEKNRILLLKNLEWLKNKGDFGYLGKQQSKGSIRIDENKYRPYKRPEQRIFSLSLPKKKSDDKLILNFSPLSRNNIPSEYKVYYIEFSPSKGMISEEIEYKYIKDEFYKERKIAREPVWIKHKENFLLEKDKIWYFEIYHFQQQPSKTRKIDLEEDLFCKQYLSDEDELLF